MLPSLLSTTVYVAESAGVAPVNSSVMFLSVVLLNLTSRVNVSPSVKATLSTAFPAASI
jgi:hypothetical protein